MSRVSRLLTRNRLCHLRLRRRWSFVRGNLTQLTGTGRQGGPPATLLGVPVNQIKAASSWYAHMLRPVCIFCEDCGCLGVTGLQFRRGSNLTAGKRVKNLTLRRGRVGALSGPRGTFLPFRPPQNCTGTKPLRNRRKCRVSARSKVTRMRQTTSGDR